MQKAGIKFGFGSIVLLVLVIAAGANKVSAQVTARARMDATTITVGDQARLFLEVVQPTANTKVEWAAIPDTFNRLEVVEKGKIDTLKSATGVTYKQRLLITGFDSGLFTIPSFKFAVLQADGSAVIAQTDSFALAVQTVAVDTTQAFKPIKGVIVLPSSWVDYIWYIAGGLILLILGIAGTIYYMRRKKNEPAKPAGPVETLQEHSLRLLSELEGKNLWQQKKVKEYYVELTDIVRSYIEARFNTPAMELTTDELLYKAQLLRELQPYHSLLASILPTADLAKFAKAEPLPEQHTEAMEKAKELVVKSTPVISEPPTETQA